MFPYRISPPEANGKIPNFSLQGQPQTPDVLSNKVILTPVSPGNQRGALWAEQPLTQQGWVADVDFRANGPERGGGNLNIWLANGGEGEIGSSSIYTVGRFEGLALVIDTHGGSGGMIRGFLNDGAIDYSNHHNVDELAFGHCQYPYRNLGRPSQIKLRQTSDVFKVEIDGRLCFESDKFIMPSGYYFGVTAATPDNPDSFEIFKMVVMSDTSAVAGSNGKVAQKSPSKPSFSDKTKGFVDEDFGDDLPDEDADVFQTSRQQFQDLHNRLQASTHQLSATYRSVSKHAQMDEKRHAEIKDLFGELKAELVSRSDEVGELQKRVKDLEKEVRGMRNDLGKKIQANERTFKGYLTDHHATLTETMAGAVPGHGKLIFVFIGTQLVLAGAYVWYKRRRATMPKKYL